MIVKKVLNQGIVNFISDIEIFPVMFHGLQDSTLMMKLDQKFITQPPRLSG